jgi:hypothetical protein
MFKKIIWLAPLLLLVAAAFTWKKNLEKVCVTCDPNLSGVEKIVCLAEAFKSTLTASQINTLQLSHTLSNAKQWSNLPVTFVPRLGLRFGDLSATQLTAAKELIQAATGAGPAEGYPEIEQLWAADQYLSGQYYIAFLGAPSATGSWELQTGGHHLAVANTYANGALSGATPSFRAVEPYAAFNSGGNTYQPIKEEHDALAAMLGGLSASQLTSAKLGSTFNDILLGPNKDWQFPTTKSGIACSQLDATQKNLVLAAIRTYVNDLDSVNAAAIMNLYSAQIDDTFIAYSGNASLSIQKDYVRIDGPRVWIEYSVQNGIILTPTHPHSVWRDHQSDYGGLGNPAAATSSVSAFAGSFRLFPNPASHTTTADIETPGAGALVLRVFDMQGRALPAGLTMQVTAGNHRLPLDVRALPAGNYVCRLEFTDPQSVRSTASQAFSKQ